MVPIFESQATILPAAGAGPTVVVIDDDNRLRDSTADFLREHGLHVFTGADGPALTHILAAGGVDVVVLDLVLPGEDGLSICRRLAAQASPPGIIMISAASADVDRIIGLECGADDYLAKPFNPRELLARIRALMRRVDRVVDEVAPPELLYRFDGWLARPMKSLLQAPDGALVLLTGQEFALLNVFLDRPQQTLSREELLQALRGRQTHAFERIIDAQVSRLRRKLNACAHGPAELIRTVRNVGYIFTATVVRATRPAD